MTAELTAVRAVVLTLAVVGTSWADAWQNGVIDAASSAIVVDYHAVLAVGYADGSAIPGVPWDSLIVKNSWASSWGDAGYGYISERYIDSFTVAAHVVEGGNGS